MEDIPSFKDFYDKPLISIGPKDLATIITAGQGINESKTATHWLIALIWMETTVGNGWKVAVYPVFKNKMNWNWIPYYQSKLFGSYEEASKLSEIVDNYARRDLLTSSSFKQQYANNIKGYIG